MKEDAPQRVHDLRPVFNAVRYWARSGCSWRYLPHDFPPWEAVYQQFDRWLKASVFAALVQDLRELLRVAQGREPQPTACILDSRTLQSTPESGHRGGYDGAKKKKGSKAHIVVNTLGHLLLVAKPKKTVTFSVEQKRNGLSGSCPTRHELGEQSSNIKT
jgi:transposase